MQSRYLRDFDAQLSFMVKDLLLVRHCHFLQWVERLWYNFGTNNFAETPITLALNPYTRLWLGKSTLSVPLRSGCGPMTID